MNSNILEFLSFIIIALSFFSLVSNNIISTAKYVVIQGIIAAIFVMLTNFEDLWLFSTIVIIIKGFAFPFILNSIIRKTNISNYMDKSISKFYIYLSFIVIFIISIKFLKKMPYVFMTPWVFISSVITILSSLFYFVINRKILSQIIGYIFLENGIYILGASLSVKQPSIVEIALLLDIFIAIFIMGVVSFHVIDNLESDSVDDLANLKDTY